MAFNNFSLFIFLSFLFANYLQNFNHSLCFSFQFIFICLENCVFFFLVSFCFCFCSFHLSTEKKTFLFSFCPNYIAIGLDKCREKKRENLFVRLICFFLFVYKSFRKKKRVNQHNVMRFVPI